MISLSRAGNKMSIRQRNRQLVLFAAKGGGKHDGNSQAHTSFRSIANTLKDTESSTDGAAASAFTSQNRFACLDCEQEDLGDSLRLRGTCCPFSRLDVSRMSVNH
jgi:hypothetical protein